MTQHGKEDTGSAWPGTARSGSGWRTAWRCRGIWNSLGVADLAPTLAIRALKEKGMPYRLFLVEGADKTKFDALGIPIAGTFDELIHSVDVMLDSSPGGVGAKNKELYEKAGVKAIFQGGEKNSVADVFFHGYANYERGVGMDYLKLTSCNTTGLIRSVDCLDRAYGIDRVAITIIRRVADPGRLSTGDSRTRCRSTKRRPTRRSTL